MSTATTEAPRVGQRRLALIGLAIIVLAAASLEGFVLPVLHQLQHDFGVDAATGALASVVPTVITVIVTPLAGRLADVYGAGKTLAALLLIVVVGGLSSAFAPSLALFIAGQGLQGFALGIIPVGFVALRFIFANGSIKTASGVLVAMSVAGTGLGVLIAGPMIDVATLASRAVGGSVAVGIAIGAGYAPIVFLVPQMIAQPQETGYGLGATATQTGYFLSAAYAAGVIASIAAGRLARRFEARVIGAIAMALLGVASVVILPGSTPAMTVLTLVLAGIGAAAASTIAYASAAIGASEYEVGVSTALITIARAVGGALATQIVASLITGAGAVPALGDFQASFIVAALLSLGGAALALWLLPRERAEVATTH